MTTAYATGISKHEIAYSAVVAHPFVTAETILAVAPALERQAIAASVLNELFCSGRLDRRNGATLYEYFPKSHKPPAPTRAEQLEALRPESAEPPEAWQGRHSPTMRPPAPRQTKAQACITAVAAHPGNTARRLCELEPSLGDVENIKTVLSTLAGTGQIDRVRGVGRGCPSLFYERGKAPAVPPGEEPEGKATAAEVERADIAAVAALAKAAAPPAVDDFAAKVETWVDPTREIKAMLDGDGSPPPSALRPTYRRRLRNRGQTPHAQGRRPHRRFNPGAGRAWAQAEPAHHAGARHHAQRPRAIIPAGEAAAARQEVLRPAGTGRPPRGEG